MSIVRSSNCATYYDSLSLLVEGTVSVPGKEDTCSVDVTAFSCQTSAFEKADAQTEEVLLSRGTEMLRKLSGNCLKNDATPVITSVRTNQIGAKELEYSPKKLKNLGMVSNCFREGNDPNHATHMARATCHPMEAMTDAQGRSVKNVHMTFRSNLAACDISDDAMPQVQEDLRKVAMHNAYENGFKVAKPEDLACDVSILPVV